MSEVLVEDDPSTNVRFPFKVLSTKYGRAFIEYCRAAWAANAGCLSEEEFKKINGGIPDGFFRKLVCSS